MKLAELKMSEDDILAAPMNEMANLYPTQTGLPVVIWFGEVGGQHGPRIKVSNVRGKFAAHDCFVIAVAKTPKVLTLKSVGLSADEVQDVLDWTQKNYEVLMKLWKIHETGDGDAHEALGELRPLSV